MGRVGKSQRPKTRQGTREDLGIYVRSSWEANFARYLNWLKDNNAIYRWEYEPDTFWFEAIKRGTRHYTPDFKVWDTAESEPFYYEVKGYMDAKSKTKLKRMKKYYPSVRVVVIDAKAYRMIKKDVHMLIAGWE